MPHFIKVLKKRIDSHSYFSFVLPALKISPDAPELLSKGDRPLKMSFQDQLKALIYFHLQEHKSARDLIQNLNEDEFARQLIAPENGISRSSFSEIINTRGLEQLQFVFEQLYKQTQDVLPEDFGELGDLVAIDGTLIDAVLSMYWADYRKGSKKAKGHLGFDINRGVPNKVYLTGGNGAERAFVSRILCPGQTGVMDRGYQSHKDFDLLQQAGKHFICRIKTKTKRTVVNQNPVDPDSYVFYDSVVLLGTPGINQTAKPVRVVGYQVESTKYFVATDRHDLTAEQIATAYKLRWKIETFFKWWKQYLKVYHLIARSEYGLMVQILGGLITYLLMAIHCRTNFNEPVSIKRVRELRLTIRNELYGTYADGDDKIFKEHKKSCNYAKT